LPFGIHDNDRLFSASCRHCAAAGTPRQAAEQDIAILAVNWPSVQAALFSVPDWKGRVLVDATNRVAGYSPLTLGDISGRTSSELVADLTPGAKLVKAFNSVPMSWIFDLSSSTPRTVLFPFRRRRQREEVGRRSH
jgi:predicted dinucleotide-binding enzyme